MFGTEKKKKDKNLSTGIKPRLIACKMSFISAHVEIQAKAEPSQQTYVLEITL